MPVLARCTVGRRVLITIRRLRRDGGEAGEEDDDVDDNKGGRSEAHQEQDGDEREEQQKDRGLPKPPLVKRGLVKTTSSPNLAGPSP